MAVTNRIALLFVFSGLLLISLLAGYVAQREYQVALNEIVNGVVARTLNRAELQLYFHQQNTPGLQRILADFIEPEAAQSAAAFSNVGELLTSRGREDAEEDDTPSLKSVRSVAAVTDISLTAFDKDQNPVGAGFWSSLTASAPTIQLVVPVFSPVNPMTQDPTFTDLTSALETAEANNSLVVIGYIQLGIDRSVLLREVRPHILRVVATSFLLFCLFTLATLLVIQRTSTRLDQLTRFASKILSGATPAKIDTVEGDEFFGIAQVLNNAVASSQNNASESMLEHKLLKMQAEERASRLSQQELELNKATIEISSTKEQLRRLAYYDSLTSLPNRHLFAEQLSVLLRQCARSAKSLAVLFINFNNFHRINESLGRNTGDLMLQETGKRLISCLRSSDILSHQTQSNESLNVSRLGGDEFAVVLSQLDNVDTVGLVAERIIAKLCEPMLLDGHELVVSPRIGIAFAPRDGMEVEALLKAAGTAMHHAKSKNESAYLFYHEDMDGSGEADFKMETELRKAIERGELRLHYQPQVNTNDGSIVCAEALLRWEHPEYGFVSPATFVALAEKIGLIWELGDWALVEACRQMKVICEQSLKLPRIAINVSPQQFKPTFVSRVVEVLELSRLAPSMLELGLSEAILMDHDTDVLKILQELKAIGVYLSLENFGTLHAPMSYLSRYPLDEIKIDRSFVADCDKRKDTARLVKAIIAMSRSLDLRTVAEGVETEGEYRFLVESGVSVMRGYLFSKPIPAAELRKQLVVPWHFMSQIQRMALLADLNRRSD